MTEEQRRALFALREALRLCDGAAMPLCGTVRIEADGRSVAFDFDEVGVLCTALDAQSAERYLGDATQEAAHGGTVSWRFRVAGMGILRWEGLSSRGWWDTEAKRREVQLMAKGGRTFRLDFATSQVYEVLP